MFVAGMIDFSVEFKKVETLLDHRRNDILFVEFKKVETLLDHRRNDRLLCGVQEG